MDDSTAQVLHGCHRAVLDRATPAGSAVAGAAMNDRKRTRAAAKPIGNTIKMNTYSETLLVYATPGTETASGLRPNLLNYLLHMAAGPGQTPTTMDALLPVDVRWSMFTTFSYIVLTGQAQVREPTVTFEHSQIIHRLVNVSGIMREDCGGTPNPAFPFISRKVNGSLTFYTELQLVEGRMRPRCTFLGTFGPLKACRTLRLTF